MIVESSHVRLKIFLWIFISIASPFSFNLCDIFVCRLLGAIIKRIATIEAGTGTTLSLQYYSSSKTLALPVFLCIFVPIDSIDRV